MNRFVLAIAICVVAGGCTPEPLPPPPPPPPVVTPAIYDLVLIPGGPFWADELRCANPFQPKRPHIALPGIEQTLPPFKIDRHVASCADYQRCIDDGGCEQTPYMRLYCRAGIAQVQYETAAAYCAWRGARLQSYAEWQRAARGTDGRRFPGGSTRPTDCQESDIPRSGLPRCLRTSPAGIEYGTRSVGGEWTRDLDCDRQNNLHPVRISLGTDTIADVGSATWAELQAEIRCVREP